MSNHSAIKVMLHLTSLHFMHLMPVDNETDVNIEMFSMLCTIMYVFLQMSRARTPMGAVPISAIYGYEYPLADRNATTSVHQ